MRFRVPALDQSDCSICYNYDLNYTIMHGFNMFAWQYREIEYSPSLFYHNALESVMP